MNLWASTGLAPDGRPARRNAGTLEVNETLEVSQFAKQHGSKLHTKYGIDFSKYQPFGCGAYGCVFRYEEDERYVAKLTMDKREAPLGRLLVDLRKTAYADGLLGIVFIKAIHERVAVVGGRYIVDLLIRENVTPLELHEKKYRGPGLSADEEKMYSTLQDIAYSTPNYWNRSISSQEMLEKIEPLIEQAPLLADALATMTDLDNPIFDTHGNNVGRTITYWPGHPERPKGSIVLHDFGMTDVKIKAPTAKQVQGRLFS